MRRAGDAAAGACFGVFNVIEVIRDVIQKGCRHESRKADTDICAAALVAGVVMAQSAIVTAGVRGHSHHDHRREAEPERFG